MNCVLCQDTGVIVKDLGMGIRSFGPCLVCDIHLLNKKRVEQERLDLSAGKNMDKHAKENRGAHLLARRRADWNLYRPERCEEIGDHSSAREG